MTGHLPHSPTADDANGGKSLLKVEGNFFVYERKR